MFKSLACFVVVAAVVANCNAYVQSASSNSGMNVASANSHVAQNNIQNAQAVGGYGYAVPAPYYAAPAPIAAPVPAPAPYPGYYGFDPVPAYGYAPAAYGAAVNSQSTNTGANMMSSDSTVAQNNVQNAVRY